MAPSTLRLYKADTRWMQRMKKLREHHDACERRYKKAQENVSNETFHKDTSDDVGRSDGVMLPVWKESVTPKQTQGGSDGKTLLARNTSEGRSDGEMLPVWKESVTPKQTQGGSDGKTLLAGNTSEGKAEVKEEVDERRKLVFFFFFFSFLLLFFWLWRKLDGLHQLF
ncbi:uncharacterized protein LOC144035304 isoform X2 [Vanacampus margaritifer]